MGIYIDPPMGTKEEWLRTYAIEIDAPSEHYQFDFSLDCRPVCLVQNLQFSAAGVAYDQHELTRFLSAPSRGDTRPTTWYLAGGNDLRSVISASLWKEMGLKPKEGAGVE